MKNPHEDLLRAVYAPVASQLLAHHRQRPDDVFIVVSPRNAPLLVRPMSREAAVDELLTLADMKWATPEALRGLATQVLRSKSEVGWFDCVVLAQGACGMFHLRALSRREEGIHAVSMTIASARGISDEDAPGHLMPGFGSALRSPDCADCTQWAAALRAAGIPLVGRSSKTQPAVEGGRCATCVAELDAVVRIAKAEYGLSAAEAREAARPESVLRAVAEAEELEIPGER
jgi:hypothetical protein